MNQKTKNTHNVKQFDNLVCFYTNADQYMNKRSEMNAYVETFQPDIIGITEVKPKNGRFSIQESEVTIDNFEMFHNFEEEGRGIILYVKSSLRPALCEDIKESEYAEKVFVECKFDSGDNLLVGLIYRSNDDPKANFYAEKLNELFGIVSRKKATHKLILGDFNYPQIDWTSESSKVDANHIATKFLKATKDHFYTQHQKTPTRYRKGQQSNTLDLVFTNNDELITDIKTEAPLGKSDHVCLIIELSIVKIESKSKPFRNYKKTDEMKLKEELRKHNWEDLLRFKNVNETWDTIKDNINNAIEVSTPMCTPNGKRSKKFLDRSTLETVRKKHRLYRKWQRTKNPEDHAQYSKANNKSRKECRKAQMRYEEKVAKDCKNNPRAFYSYTNSRIKCRSGIADLLKADGTKTKTDAEKAELLNMFFQSVFTEENPGPLPHFEGYDYTSTLENFDISVEEVKKLLTGLDNNKAPGPDSIRPLILSLAAEELALPITLLFRKSLQEGVLPQEWKMAYISPIFKKGSKSAVNNYRPVSLTCILCKLLEKLVRKHIMQHLVDNDLISQHQHGFVPGRSCTTQLLEALDSWTEIVDSGGGVDVIYMDYQKAFDSVPHRRLLMKLQSLGVDGYVLRWVQDFLSNRKQRVIINGSSSQEANVTSGIPQGSVLGPLLFVAYINDLPRGLQSTAKIFADDTKLYARSDSIEGPQKLQSDLDKLQDWSNKWLLRFHPEKCCVLKVGRDNNNEYFMKQDTQSGNRTIKLKTTGKEKDLGVIIDDNLSFKDHVFQSTAKANKIAGLIRRTFSFLSDKTFVLLFKSLVRPLLEYGHTIWQPQDKYLCKEVEDVQRRATKMLGHLKNLSYPERLKKLKLPSLEYRRQRGDMIEVFKYMNGYYNSEQPKLERATTVHLRGHQLKLKKQSCRKEVRKNFFINRVHDNWNSLPESVVLAPSINAFKNRLDKFWKDHPIIYNPTCQ